MVIGGTEEGEVGGWEVGRGGGWRGFERVVEGDGVVGLEVCPDQTKVCFAFFFFFSFFHFFFFFSPSFFFSFLDLCHLCFWKNSNIF